jgi:AcrR family transcriptional regulator
VFVALTRKRVIDEAVRLLDEGGLESVTFHKLADRSTQPPAEF